MPNLPEASLLIDESASAPATGLGPIVVMGCVSKNADSTPRQFASTTDMLAEHNFAPGVDYCAIHFQKTRKPVIFIGLPITTVGVVGQQDTTGVTGTSAITVTAAASGFMDETRGVFTVTQGTIVGTDQILGTLSMDGGWTTQNVRVGTASSYTVPYVGVVLNFGPGTLNVGDVFTFATTAPMWGSTAISTARTALAAQQVLSRSWLTVGDVTNSTFANYVVTEANGYETAQQRFVYARTQVADRVGVKKSKVAVKMTGAVVNLTFASGGHTITRDVGSWITDGFVTGDMVTVAGSASNNGLSAVSCTVTSATVLTFASGIVSEGPTAGISVSASEALTFVASGFTVTRSGNTGSWLSDGFSVGDNVTFAGTASNNFTATITVLTATVMTFAATVVNEGPVASSGVTVTKNLTMAAWAAAQAAAFATVDAQRRVDLGLGRARVASPITGWVHRRPAQWAVSAREYTHDVQIPSYRKEDGPLDGFSITDANGNIVEFDERVTGGGLAGRFTCLRSYGNGPLGAFVALSLTRDTEGKVLSRTHNMAVADVACTTVQTETENAIGQVLQLNDNGTGTDASLHKIEERVNTALQLAVLQDGKEGPRASKAVWTASRSDVLSAPGATLNGTLDLELNGTLEQISTRVVVS